MNNTRRCLTNYWQSGVSGVDGELYQQALKIPLQSVPFRRLQRAGIELLVRRDDLIDDQLSGNKFYKLFYNLQQARQQGFTQLMSFGGAYSNHLYALAAAGKRYGFNTLGVIRGERPTELSPTLKDAEAWGMQLVFISRADYRDKHDAAVITCLQQQYGSAYWIPEGGANFFGAKGMQVAGRALEQQLTGDYTAVCVACGTGTSLAGLAAGIAPDKIALGFSVLKGAGELGITIDNCYRELQPATNVRANWRLISGFHAGGYGKKHPANIFRFWQEFEHATGLALDPVYTLKMFWGITRLAERGYWPKGSRLVAVHTGGLQGRRGFSCPDTLSI